MPGWERPIPILQVKMVKYTEDQIIDHVLTYFAGRKIAILSPVIRGRKGHYRELFDQTQKKDLQKYE